MKRLVADTGPLLHLREAGALHLLPLIGTVSVPPLVLTEVRFHAPALWPGVTPGWLKVEPLSVPAQQRSSAWRKAGLLDGGEAQALAVAAESKPDWFLTDDAAARLMAEAMGIETHGSLGVVLWAAANHLAGQADAQTHLSGLENSSLWMSPHVRAAARSALVKIFLPR